MLTMITYELLWATRSVSDGGGRVSSPLPTFFSILIINAVMRIFGTFALVLVFADDFYQIAHLCLWYRVCLNIDNFCHECNSILAATVLQMNWCTHGNGNRVCSYIHGLIYLCHWQRYLLFDFKPFRQIFFIYRWKHRKNCECCPGPYLSTSVY